MLCDFSGYFEKYHFGDKTATDTFWATLKIVLVQILTNIYTNRHAMAYAFSTDWQ